MRELILTLLLQLIKIGDSVDKLADAILNTFSTKPHSHMFYDFLVAAKPRVQITTRQLAKCE
jgi:hypothetical protein